MSIEIFKTSTKRNPTILYLIFGIITLGFYEYFWIFSRKKALNKISESKVSGSLPIIFVIIGILAFGLGFYSGVLGTGNVFDRERGKSFTEYANICLIVSIIFRVVIAFSMKKVLKEFSDNNEMNISYNGFLTFFLNFVYINYKVNENIDSIAQNKIVDKVDTPTSNKEEITSEKTPDSPEDRLKKLADMKEKGLINEDEFNTKKEEILKEI